MRVAHDLLRIGNDEIGVDKVQTGNGVFEGDRCRRIVEGLHRSTLGGAIAPSAAQHLATLLEVVPSVAMFASVFPRSLINVTVRHEKYTMSIFFVISPLARVNRPI